MKKVVFVSSSGGHLAELLKLESLFKEYEYLLVTEKTSVTEKLEEKYNVGFLKYGPNKNIIKYFWAIICNICICLKIVIKFKPDTIVSTGAQVGGIMCFFGKIFRKKVI